MFWTAGKILNWCDVNSCSEELFRVYLQKHGCIILKLFHSRSKSFGLTVKRSINLEMNIIIIIIHLGMEKLKASVHKRFWMIYVLRIYVYVTYPNHDFQNGQFVVMTWWEFVWMSSHKKQLWLVST